MHLLEVMFLWVPMANLLFKRPLSDIIGIQNISTEIPFGFILNQNYPNPFNPSTIINFSLPLKSFVKLKVYNILGKRIKFSE